jgi:hypothetical protein
MASIIKKMWKVFTFPYRKIQEEIRWRKTMKKLKKESPFIYKG